MLYQKLLQLWVLLMFDGTVKSNPFNTQDMPVKFYTSHKVNMRRDKPEKPFMNSVNLPDTDRIVNYPDLRSSQENLCYL